MKEIQMKTMGKIFLILLLGGLFFTGAAKPALAVIRSQPLETIQNAALPVQPSSLIATMADPLDNWSMAYSGENTIYDIVEGDNRLVAITGTGSQVLTSLDGKLWMVYTVPEIDKVISLTYGNGLFVAVGDRKILSSPDGINWTLRSEGNNFFFFDVSYKANLFVAVGNQGSVMNYSRPGVFISADGINWKISSQNGTTGLDYTFNVNGEIWVTDGDSASVTQDGLALKWRSMPHPMYQYPINSIVYGKGTYVLSFADGETYYSSDGIQWEDGQYLNEITHMFFAQDVFVAVTKKGKIYRSDDGITWTPSAANAGTTNYLSRLTFSPQYKTFIATGQGLILRSDPLIAPAVPQISKTYSNNASSIHLVWKNPSDTAADFMIYRSVDAAGPFSHLATVKNTTAYLDQKLQPGTYYYKIRASNLYGSTNYSNVVSGSTKGSIRIGLLNPLPLTVIDPPAAPTELTATASTSSKIILKWQDNATNESGCRLERKSGSDGFVAVGDADANGVTLTDGGLLANTAYTYRLCAYNNAGDSAYSNEATAVTQKAAILLPNLRTTLKLPILPVEPIIPLNPPGEALPADGADDSSDGDEDGVAPASPVSIRLVVGSREYFVNGSPSQMDTSPLMQDGRALLPIRYVAQAIGAEVKWQASEQKTTIILQGTTVEVWVGKSTARVNGTEVPIDANNSKVSPLVIPPGRVMLPLRFVAEKLGCDVKWDPQDKSIRVEK